MVSHRRVCVVTTARSDYGAAKWLLKALQEDSALVLQVVVTGSHVSQTFGCTYKEIEADGFTIDETIDSGPTADEPRAITRAMGACLGGLGGAFARLKPHIIVVLGDRYELLPVCTAATLAGIPIAHVSGGDVTGGAMDDAIRHAVTKLSHLHFPAHQAAAAIIRTLGEAPERIFTVGELSLEAFRNAQFISRESLGRTLGLDPNLRWLLLTYHPVTLSRREDWLPPLEHLFVIMEALADAQVIMTYPNADPGYETIRELLHKKHEMDPMRFRLERSLGQRLLFSLMKEAYGMVGNSSSALIEAPCAELPAINIGDRQRGRVRGANVIDADGDRASIARAFEILESRSFRDTLAGMANPYGDGTASKRVAKVLRGVELEGLRLKPVLQA